LVATEGATSATETARGTVERIEPTKAERAVARRVAESKATAPHIYLEAEIRTADAGPARAVRACGIALREHARLNGAYRDGAFELYSRVNVGVALQGPEGLVVPTVFDADLRSAAEIGAELDDLGRRAAGGRLSAPDLAGGTFTLQPAPVGATGSLTPILHQGQAAALALGGVTERALVEGGEVVAGRALTAVLACDARMIGAEEGARFLDRVRAVLESPEELS
jgi:pyruvate dehydrogenase E2 component (dihydrolipoamide acetyltransferase)